MNDHGVKQNLECFRLQGHGTTCSKVVIIGLKTWKTIIGKTLGKGKEQIRTHNLKLHGENEFKEGERADARN